VSQSPEHSEGEAWQSASPPTATEIASSSFGGRTPRNDDEGAGLVPARTVGVIASTCKVRGNLSDRMPNIKTRIRIEIQMLKCQNCLLRFESPTSSATFQGRDPALSTS
jgi:hypothetical protein